MYTYHEFLALTKRKVVASGVLLQREGEPVALALEDPHAHEGVAVVTTAELLGFVGVTKGEHLTWTREEFQAVVEKLPAEAVLS